MQIKRDFTSLVCIISTQIRGAVLCKLRVLKRQTCKLRVVKRQTYVRPDSAYVRTLQVTCTSLEVHVKPRPRQTMYEPTGSARFNARARA